MKNVLQAQISAAGILNINTMLETYANITLFM